MNDKRKAGQSHGIAKGAGKGKRGKKFLEKKDALSLAVSIVDEQEHKTSSKTERIHVIKNGSKQDGSISKPKSRLEEKKAALAVQLAKTKREHVKRRKAMSKKKSTSTGDKIPPANRAPRKTVSFAP